MMTMWSTFIVHASVNLNAQCASLIQTPGCCSIHIYRVGRVAHHQSNSATVTGEKVHMCKAVVILIVATLLCSCCFMLGLTLILLCSCCFMLNLTLILLCSCCFMLNLTLILLCSCCFMLNLTLRFCAAAVLC